MEDIEHFPAVLHSAAGSGVLGDVGHGRVQRGPVPSLQTAAAHHHHGALCLGQNLGSRQRMNKGKGQVLFSTGHTVPRKLRKIKYHRNPEEGSQDYLAERMRSGCNLLQYLRRLPEMVIGVA